MQKKKTRPFFSLLDIETPDGAFRVYRTKEDGVWRLYFRNDTVEHDSSIPESIARKLEAALKQQALKLFVWEQCFYDYTSGLGVVLAHDREEAIELLRKKIGYDHPDLGRKPKEHALGKPAAFFVHGGG